MCSTLRPRSSTRVLSPLSHSSFAAQPPEIPEPMTIASKVGAGWRTRLTYGGGGRAASADVHFNGPLLRPGQRAPRQRGDLSLTDAHGSHRIQPRLGIDDTAVQDH